MLLHRGNARISDMGTMKCLACGHDNEAGEASCISCFASLNLQLCHACEAINAENAARCHSCGVQPYPTLPSAWVISGQPRPGSRGLRAALHIVPVLAVAAFGTYHFFSGAPELKVLPTEFKVAPAEESNVTTEANTRGPDSASSGGASAPAALANP